PSAVVVVYPTYTPVIYIPPSAVPATIFPATAIPPKPLWQLPVHWSDIYKLCKKGIDHKRENQSSDPAWDFCVSIGTKVYPIADGVVIYASVSDGFGLGGVVQIYHPCGWISTYGNLGRVFVRAGDSVGVGTVLGTVGMTGENRPLRYGPVLHLAVELLGGYKIPDDIGKPKTGQQDMLNADVELAYLASGLEYCWKPPCFVSGYEPTVPPARTRPPRPTATEVIPTQTNVPMATVAPTRVPSPVPTNTLEPTFTAIPSPTETVMPTATWTPVPSSTITEEPSAMPFPTETAEPSPTAVPTAVPTNTEEPTSEPTAATDA
ncbi:MAG: peptidoglycan DD-metalloendopeptidase family protein, partial [Patescibacteria group bacterium]